VYVDLDNARSQLRVADRQLTNAKRVLTEVQARANSGEDLAVGNVIVHRGEELARQVIPAGASEDLVRATLRNLIADANDEVSRRVSMARGRARRVCFDPSDTEAQQVPDQMVTEFMTENHAVNGQIPATATPETHSVVVRAIATRNSSDGNGDPVVVVVDGQLNELAFRKGDEVASIEVSTASTTGLLLKGLVGFLQRQVREEAVKHSIMPDASGRVGEIDYEELLDVVARIKRLPGQARIGAVAATDAWSAGPLQLDFYVVPAETRVAKKKGED
jgi:hypothetical protein